MVAPQTMMFLAKILLLALWMLGFLTGVTLDGFLHVLLFAAAVMIVVSLLQQSAKRY